MTLFTPCQADSPLPIPHQSVLLSRHISEQQCIGENYEYRNSCDQDFLIQERVGKRAKQEFCY